ncbi:hypothetical protein ABBQ32_012434 [Trebouxia sp. C0010 RCD-2024]
MADHQWHWTIIACWRGCRLLPKYNPKGAGANSLTAEVARYRMSGSSDFDKATSTEALRVLQCWQPCSPQSSLQATSKHTLLGFAQWAGLMSTKQQAEAGNPYTSSDSPAATANLC